MFITNLKILLFQEVEDDKIKGITALLDESIKRKYGLDSTKGIRELQSPCCYPSDGVNSSPVQNTTNEYYLCYPSQYCMTNATPQNQKSTTISKSIYMKAGADDRLNELIEEHPEIGKEVKKILEYNGIQNPWNPIDDLQTTKQHQLPSACMLYQKIRDELTVFERLKDLISDNLLNVETYVGRAKNYMTELKEILRRYFSKMNLYLKKITSQKASSMKREYNKKFNEVRNDSIGIIEKYCAIDRWLTRVVSCFKQLFN